MNRTPRPNLHPSTPQADAIAPKPDLLAFSTYWGTVAVRLPLTCSLAIGLILTSALSLHAQDSHFGRVALAPGFAPPTGTLQGETGGTSSLAAIAHYDDQEPQHLCSGYTQDITTPDHILELTEGFEQLTLAVESRGQDTTLVVRGPQGLYCGDDVSEFNPDAQVSIAQLSPGTYEIWVGTVAPGQKYRYRLNVTEN